MGHCRGDAWAGLDIVDPEREPERSVIALQRFAAHGRGIGIFSISEQPGNINARLSGATDLVGGEVRRTVCGGAAPGAITVATETGKGLPGCTAAAPPG